MSGYCNGLATDLHQSRALGQVEWEFRYRIAQPAPGAATGFHPGVHHLTFNRSFFTQLDAWARNLDERTRAAGMPGAAWWGEVGSIACQRPTAAHNRARGFDLCTVGLADGSRIDANTAHSGDGRTQRRYLALTASLRRYFSTVLTVHYNAAHRDHLHIDDLRQLAPIRSDLRSDTALIQSSANLLAGHWLAVDGVWGSLTQAGYDDLLDGFGLTCLDPRGEVADALVLLDLVARTALADLPFGTLRSDACASLCDVLGIDLPIVCDIV
jgi:Extensin-like protein C-terminus